VVTVAAVSLLLCNVLYPCCAHCNFTDGRNVAIGRVIAGLDVVLKAAGVFAVDLRPAVPVVVRNAGALPQEEWAAVDKAIAAEAARLAAAAKAGAAGGAKVAGKKQAAKASASQ
jgi:hypothetical protein